MSGGESDERRRTIRPRLNAARQNSDRLRLKVATNQLGEGWKCYSVPPLKLKGIQHGLLSAMAAARQEG